MVCLYLLTKVGKHYNRFGKQQMFVDKLIGYFLNLL